MKIAIVGGGWSGCAAAVSAAKLGAQVVLLERTDMLLGTGLVGGIMRNNGRYTATEEMIAMGAGELFRVIDENCLHRDIEFPGHRHASLYNVATMEPVVRQAVSRLGIEVRCGARIDNVERKENGIQAITGKEGEGTLHIEADAFIDATGTAGPPGNCIRYGNGCAMCILRCPSFGGRVSITAKAGIEEIVGRKGSQVGAMSGSCKLLKESLAPEIVDRLNATGVAVVPVPPSERSEGKLAIKACQQYALPEFADNLVVLDTGHAKLMVPFMPLDALRRVPGFENARYEDPYAGGIGNSIRYIGMAPRDDALKVRDMNNLFCAGEKAGLLVGHTEAIVTGTLAGLNTVRQIRKERLLVLPDTLATGDAIACVRTGMQTEEGIGLKYTFSGSHYFERMKERGLYTTNRRAIEERVAKAGLTGVFSGSPQ